LAWALWLAAPHPKRAESFAAGFADSGIFRIAGGSKWRDDFAVVAFGTATDDAGVDDRVVLTRYKEMGPSNDAGAQ
jgi:hypothetical protein